LRSFQVSFDDSFVLVARGVALLPIVSSERLTNWLVLTRG
jgi:hypothetical protein